ncbi:MAG: glutamine amidotransferase, partial [Pseudomonadota bacterium]
MCGIVGLFLKDKALEPELGRLLSEMLVTMTGRGPDSAGIAIYTHGDADRGKITVQSQSPDADFPALEADLSKALGQGVEVQVKSTHAVITLPETLVAEARAAVKRLRPGITVMSAGSNVETGSHVFRQADFLEDL